MSDTEEWFDKSELSRLVKKILSPVDGEIPLKESPEVIKFSLSSIKEAKVLNSDISEEEGGYSEVARKEGPKKLETLYGESYPFCIVNEQGKILLEKMKLSQSSWKFYVFSFLDKINSLTGEGMSLRLEENSFLHIVGLQGKEEDYLLAVEVSEKLNSEEETQRIVESILPKNRKAFLSSL